MNGNITYYTVSVQMYKVTGCLQNQGLLFWFYETPSDWCCVSAVRRTGEPLNPDDSGTPTNLTSLFTNTQGMGCQEDTLKVKRDKCKQKIHFHNLKCCCLPEDDTVEL